MAGRVLHFPQLSVSSSEGRATAKRLLSMPFAERSSPASGVSLEDPETLLSVCGLLDEKREGSPAEVREEAEFFYRFIERPLRPIGLFDEREYFLGEFALLAGTTCRHLSRRDEARLWFDRSEANFRHTINAVAALSRLAYQRLALRLEERQIDAVLEMAPPLIDSFQKLEMQEDALKCRFLEAIALMESSRLPEAIEAFEGICVDARRIGSERLLALAYTNLTQYYGLAAQPEKAIEASREAIPVLTRLGDRVGLGKVQWGIATLLREQGRLPSAILSYRSAQQEFERLFMRADVAALSLVVADLLLEVGQEGEAIREIASALPVIDELKMVPEGVAALTLLRESVRQQRINRQALRDLHGYFEDLK